MTTRESTHPTEFRCLTNLADGTECGKTYTQKANLERHERSHMGNNKSFRCQECGKMFVDSTRLKHHRWIHSGHFPYKCKDCDKGFRHISHLKTHRVLTHGEEKDFQCPVRPIKAPQCVFSRDSFIKVFSSSPFSRALRDLCMPTNFGVMKLVISGSKHRRKTLFLQMNTERLCWGSPVTINPARKLSRHFISVLFAKKCLTLTCLWRLTVQYTPVVKKELSSLLSTSLYMPKILSHICPTKVRLICLVFVLPFNTPILTYNKSTLISTLKKYYILNIVAGKLADYFSSKKNHRGE